MDAVETHERVRVIDSRGDCPNVDIVPSGGSAIAVVWPGNGALHRTFQIIKLDAGAKTRDLVHDGECVYYILGGKGTVEGVTDGSASDVYEGSMIHIGAGDSYRLRAGNEGLQILGGPCPADPSWYAKTGASA